MDSITLFVLALGLSMDAFAVSISNSMCFSGLRRNEAALTSLSFGVFQGLMPVAGCASAQRSSLSIFPAAEDRKKQRKCKNVRVFR